LEKYEFQCNACGSIFTETNENKLKVQTISCGCKRNGTSKMEQDLFNEVSKLGILAINGKKFSSYKLDNVDNKIYELDIYLPEFNLSLA
jgi:hypothetical protein